MGNRISKQLRTEFIVSTAGFHCLFWRVFDYHKNKSNRSPKDCLFFATTTISTLHAMASLVACYDQYKRWQNANNEQSAIGGHLWAFSSAYFLADFVAHLRCFSTYDQRTIPRRWDIIAHHVLFSLTWFACTYSKFIWSWNPLSIAMCGEMSTIFLNLQLFAKYFGSQTLRQISQSLFVVSWFLVRVPVVVYYNWWLIKHRKRMKTDLHLRSVLAWIVLSVLITCLQFVWSVQILRKTYNWLLT